MAPHRIYIAVQAENVVRTEFALALLVNMFPANTQRRMDVLVGMNKPDTFNTFFHSIRQAIRNGSVIGSVLFWELNVIPYIQDAPYPLTRALLENEEIDILTPSWRSESPDGVYPIPGSRTGFAFMRKPVFEKLDAPLYTTPADQEVPRIFTDDDRDFVVLCAKAGIRWYEHGGVFVDYYDEAFRQAGVEVPALGV